MVGQEWISGILTSTWDSGLQTPLTGGAVHYDVGGGSDVNDQQIWDPEHARFDSGFLPILATVPTAIAIIVLLTYVLALLSWSRPQWTRAFIEEPKSFPANVNIEARSRSRLRFALLASSILGLVSQIPRIIWPHVDISAFFHVAPWLVSISLIAIERPSTAPIPLLGIYGSVIAVNLALIVQTPSENRVEDIPAIFGILSAIGSFVVVLNMPLRHKDMPTEQICRPFHPPTNELRSPEDNMTPWQFMTVSWMSPLISLGAKRQLNDNDVWTLAYEFQHRHLHDTFRELKGSVVGRLFKANGLDLMIITFLSIIETAAKLLSPVLLQQLLRSMENLKSPTRVSLTYAALSMLVRLIAAQSSVFSLWFGRRAYERSRGEMITMLHEKTLSRKIIGAGINVTVERSPSANGQGAAVEISKPLKGQANRLWHRTRNFCLAPFSATFKLFKKDEIKQEAKEPASKGKILNLMRNDVYEVAQRFWEFSSLITKPLVLIFSIVLIWGLIGWPCLFGALTVLVAQAINALIVRALLRWERLRRVTTDTKLQKVSQVVEAIRHLRWYGWQDSWLDTIMEARQRELNFRIVTNLWSRLIGFMNLVASAMFPVAAFYAYTYLAGLPLRIDVAFPALQLFGMLENSLRDIPDLITVLLNARIAVGRINDFMNEENVADNDSAIDDVGALQLRNASFAWPGHRELVLKDITLTFPVGMTVVFGKVAAGKTALLQALLGELDMRSGDLKRPDEMIGYCSQTPWLQNMSIRDNILFSSPYEEPRYKKVLEVCALLPDLATFKDGDLSDIGENGIGLSGGQKARVALARAVYSRASILLLDDPISALDYQTSKLVVEQCFAGPLMANRKIILVTHRTELCHHLAKQGVEVVDGIARVHNELLTSALASSLAEPLTVSEKESDADAKRAQNAAVPEKFIEEERRAHGEVKASVYWEYIKAGKLKWWTLLIFALALGRLVGVASTWFLKEWGEAYNRVQSSGISDLFGRFPDPETNIRPWLTGFFLIQLAQAITYLFIQIFMVIIVYAAGRQMFQQIMHRVCHATFRFYDVTPVGRLMNRLTSDINTIDGDICGQFQAVAFSTISWISALVVIASVTPAFLIFSALLTVAFVLIFLRFLPTSQSLRRLEMVSLSPLMSNFGALLDGLMTVRAFQAQYRFQDRVIGVTDAFQKMDHFYWSLQAWLMYRFDALSACSTFVLTLIAIYTGVSPGLTAFVLIAASKFVKSTHSLCKQYGKLQMDFVSVERIVELLGLEQEPLGDVMPPASWPTFDGDVVFEDVTIRYSQNDKSALQNVSFSVKGGSTTAIVGRTGSGKSTLALAILATIAPESGQIFVDGIDVATVNKQALRSRVTFLAQDPVLFPGSMRQNLDPLVEHSDEECETVLQRVCGKHQWTLSTHIDTSGRNLSQGQRQLVGIARAVLRRSAVVILDEATASIDKVTSVELQQILREEMRESTVITIAHRLEAVVDADYCIELSNGRVSRQGEAAEMLRGKSQSEAPDY